MPILANVGVKAITTLPLADPYTIERLKVLNQPNQMLVVRLCESDEPERDSASITLSETTPLQERIDAVLGSLADRHVIPDYCI